jgi:deoxyribodipyrimidine photo-lyase
MLEGLKDAQGALESRGIEMVVRKGSPEEVAIDAGKEASLVVTDCGYMRQQKKWREKVAGEAGCLVTQVESDLVVPVGFASEKRETAARTLRPRIQEHLDDFLVGLAPTKISKQSLNMKAEGLDLSDLEKILDGMDLDRSVGRAEQPVQGRNLGGEEDVPPVPRGQLRRLHGASQPAADGRRLAHEQVPALWTDLPDLARPHGQESEDKER